MPPNISVAMATYNGEKYILEQLDSLAKQTVLPCELIVCDDGSTDSTVNIIGKFTASAPFPVRLYINESNLGYSDNFLKAATLCNGDWIAFCDQDDVWLPNKFERVSGAIEGYSGDNLVLIGHTSLLSNGNLELTGQRLPDFKRDKYLKRASHFGFFCIVGFSMICRAELLRKVDSVLRPRVQSPSVRPGCDHWTGHDQWVGMLANAVGDIAYIAEPLALWRRHEFSLTCPPQPQTRREEAKIAMAALSPSPYFLNARMALESARAFRHISSNCSHPLNETLFEASIQFSKLADSFYSRGALYTAATISSRCSAFIAMLKKNAYFWPPFRALGWKAFIKDLVFAVGLIGIKG